MIKSLPTPIPITEDQSVNVIGWTDKRSFIVKVMSEINPAKAEEDVEKIKELDGEEDDSDDTELMSLWEWAKEYEISLTQFEELQQRLETYINLEDI